MGSTQANGSAPIFTSLLEDSSASGGSLLSRLGLPFRPRGAARNVADFQIRVDGKPFSRYRAGDRVRGAVILTIVKRVRITHLTVALHGFVKAFKTPGAGADAPINPAEIPSGTSSRFRYRGNGLATLFSDEQVLSADGPLEPRKYEFQFELEFPERSLPSSIDVSLRSLCACPISSSLC
jgi:arrestin-related trafficking adapter 9